VARPEKEFMEFTFSNEERTTLAERWAGLEPVAAD
jgi:hypothetical protein